MILWPGIYLGRLSGVRGTSFPGRRESRSELAPLRRLGTLSGREGPLARVTQIVAAEGSPGLMQIPVLLYRLRIPPTLLRSCGLGRSGDGDFSVPL